MLQSGDRDGAYMPKMNDSEDTMTSSDRRIDHLVLAVRDLDAAAGTYERLGFRVGQRNRHPWGTENRLIQFGSSFLELITVGDGTAIPPHAPGRFSFGAFVRDYLGHREGLAMFVLDSPDAEADAAEFSRLGIGDFEPFFFERKGQRPDGSTTRVAFSLAFTMDPTLPLASFFVCQQHEPDSFWNADFQKHRNGATNVVEVTLDVPDPHRHSEFLSRFCGAPALGSGEDGVTVALRSAGRLRAARENGSRAFEAFAVAVPDLRQQARLLGEAGIAFRETANRLAVAETDVFGVRVEFVPDETPTG